MLFTQGSWREKRGGGGWGVLGTQNTQTLKPSCLCLWDTYIWILATRPLHLGKGCCKYPILGSPAPVLKEFISWGLYPLSFSSLVSVISASLTSGLMEQHVYSCFCSLVSCLTLCMSKLWSLNPNKVMANVKNSWQSWVLKSSNNTSASFPFLSQYFGLYSVCDPLWPHLFSLWLSIIHGIVWYKEHWV